MKGKGGILLPFLIVSRAVRRRGRRVSADSRSRSPIHDAGQLRDDERWTHPFTATPRMTAPIPATPLGFFQLFFTRELLVFLMEETNDYANYVRNELKKSSFPWSYS